MMARFLNEFNARYPTEIPDQLLDISDDDADQFLQKGRFSRKGGERFLDMVLTAYLLAGIEPMRSTWLSENICRSDDIPTLRELIDVYLEKKP